ncbi:MAG: YbhB/YbcL family Raf kinase inhibitor-like protein, partial [Candidatus Nitrosopelagicus sp.]|nr:YbhB/YbcL family Raf kinase inhibitor-like protein [Candidatus Nitrosopelagicus sp.]
MSDFSISSEDFKEGEEIPKNCGYKHGNEQPEIDIRNFPVNTKCLALIMDDPDAMGAVGKVWVHW